LPLFLLTALLFRGTRAYTFERSYGTAPDERTVGLVPQSDGGFLLVASSESASGRSGVFLVRTDARGNEVWAKYLYDSTLAVFPTAAATDSAGGCLVAGRARDGRPDWDFWAARIDSSGRVLWSRCWGVADTNDEAFAACRSRDGWYVSGYSLRDGQPDLRVVLLDSEGNPEWSVVTGTSRPDYAYGVAALSTGGCVVAGVTYPDSSRYSDVYVARVSEDGQVAWMRSYGDSLWDEARAVAVLPGGDLVLAGQSASYDSGMSFYLLRTDSTGQGWWFRTFGADGSSRAYAVCAAIQGGIIAVGERHPEGGAESQLCVLKTDAGGVLEWERLLGGQGDQYATVVLSLPDSGLAIAGCTWTDSVSRFDAYLARTSPSGTIGLGTDRAAAVSTRLHAYPDPFNCILTVNFVPHGRLSIYSASGRLVRVLSVPGRGLVRWDGLDQTGSVVPAGVYLLHIPGAPGVGVVKADR
jgi:hypothetical protein